MTSEASSTSSDKTSPAPSSPVAVSPPSLARQVSQEARLRKDSGGDSRWRTASFSVPGRVVVVPVDGSPNAKNAFDYYVENMHRADDLVVITHVPEPPSLPSFTFRGGLKVPAEKWKEIMDEANAKVSKLESDFETECIQKKLRYKVRGEYSPHTGKAICGIADSEDADVIVMGCRGLGPVKKVMLGSVSDYVVRHANRAVLVIPYKK